MKNSILIVTALFIIVTALCTVIGFATHDDPKAVDPGQSGTTITAPIGPREPNHASVPAPPPSPPAFDFDDGHVTLPELSVGIGGIVLVFGFIFLSLYIAWKIGRRGKVKEDEDFIKDLLNR